MNRSHTPSYRFVQFWIVLLVFSVGCNPKSKPTDAPLEASTDDPSALTELSTIQGDERRSALSGQTVSTEGVVTWVTTDQWKSQGFFLQQDAQEATGSSGVFVQSAVDGIEIGDRVRLTGMVSESSETGMTVLLPIDGESLIAFETIAEGQNLQPVQLPDDQKPIDWEKYESMLVRVPHDSFVVDTYNLARRGQVIVAAKPLRVPTEDNDPDDVSVSDSSAVDSVTASSVRTIKIDDGIDANNLFPIPLLPEMGTDFQTLRVGSKISSLTGIVIENDGEYVLVPTEPLQIEHAPRPKRPDLGDADLALASFNVLNFFSTIDDGRNNARGADSAEELSRQQAKLVTAIVKLDADVIGLMELENNTAAEQKLLDAINERLGDEVYAGCGIPDGFADAPGGRNAIRVGLIYRKSAVEPTRPVELLDDEAFFIARTPLVQEFKSTTNDFRFTVVVNHFKSKGGSDATGLDADQGDGQANYNATRCRQAQAVADHVSSLVDAGQTNVLVIGDLNAYSEEDPIDLLRDAGLTDLTETACPIKDPYTFVYYGQAGCLDHSFASPGLVQHVTIVSPWNINSAEPRFLDYNMEYNPAQLFSPDEFRCSDHDPVLIGIKTD